MRETHRAEIQVQVQVQGRGRETILRRDVKRQECERPIGPGKGSDCQVIVRVRTAYRIIKFKTLARPATSDKKFHSHSRGDARMLTVLTQSRANPGRAGGSARIACHRAPSDAHQLIATQTCTLDDWQHGRLLSAFSLSLSLSSLSDSLSVVTIVLRPPSARAPAVPSAPIRPSPRAWDCRGSTSSGCRTRC
jgi:hypothetical protein